MSLTQRNLQEIGQSLFISLPKQWTTLMKLKKGSKIKIMENDNGALLISPEFTITPKKTEAVITFDESFERQFFREYFKQHDRIIIKIEKESDKKTVYKIFKRFLNVQVIEESSKSMIVKCLTINDLSMQECLKRMFFLSLNMLESTKNTVDIQELRDSSSKFYYLLIMQIRRFLTEGMYAKENQISLITAMDYRMVAEKIQRICTLSTRISTLRQKEVLMNYYKKCFYCFILNNYKESLTLWKEEKKIRILYTPESIEGTIIRFAKEISMLSR